MHPRPGSDIDPVGTALRQVSKGVSELQCIDPKRLAHDGTLIAGAILGLMIVQRRIDKLRREDETRRFEQSAAVGS